MAKPEGLDSAFSLTNQQILRLAADGEEYCGFDSLGAEAVVTVPTAGANYTDAKTVTAVQAALVQRKYDLGKTGPNRDGVDGVFGPKTKAAIQKMQKDAGLEQTGKIDEGVIMALKVTPGVLPPGVTMAGRAAVQAEVALQAATKAEHAQTPGDVQQAAQDAVNASANAEPPLPPEVRQAAMDALEKSKKVTTPAQVQAVKQEVQKAAQQVATAVGPSWWTSPAWAGGWPRWQVAAVAGGSVAGLGALMIGLLSGGGAVTAAAAVGTAAVAKR